MLKPQTHVGDMRAGNATCALGAALDAVSELGTCIGYSRVRELWPIAETIVRYPCSAQCRVAREYDHRGELIAVVWHLNDQHEWTREQIADWVETIEAQAEAQGVAVPVEVPTTA